LGGRAAEEICLGRISTGAMNDLETVTKRSYGMIAYAGMGDTLPNLCYYNNQEYQFSRPYSEHTAELIDEEVKKLIAVEYERAKKILREHKEGHAELAQLLIDKEVIFAEDVERIFGKRPWISRTDEILALNDAERLAKGSDKADSTEYVDENAEIIRQKAIDAVVEKAKQNGKPVPSEAEAVVLDEKNTSSTVAVPTDKTTTPSSNSADTVAETNPEKGAASNKDTQQAERGLFD
jgi:cell division protease FtsH